MLDTTKTFSSVQQNLPQTMSRHIILMRANCSVWIALVLTNLNFAGIWLYWTLNSFRFLSYEVYPGIFGAERRLGAQKDLSGYLIRLGAKIVGEIMGYLSSTEKRVMTMCCRTLGFGKLSGAGGSSSQHWTQKTHNTVRRFTLRRTVAVIFVS